MTLKQGSKVKFDTCRRFAEHDFQEVVFSFQTPRTNDKGDILICPSSFDIKDVIWQPIFFSPKTRPKLPSGKLFSPFTFCANLTQLAAIF